MSSCRDIAKLKWQHRLQGLPADRLERVLYDCGQQPPVQAKGRSKCMWSQVVGATWGTLSQLSMDSMSMPHKEFVQELCSAVHDRDHVAILSTLASKPELAL